MCKLREEAMSRNDETGDLPMRQTAHVETESRRRYDGDGTAGDWMPIDAAEYERRKNDASFEFRQAAEVTHLAEKLAERDAAVGNLTPQVKLWDSQWVNIVNHADCYRDMSKEDAVHLAVKLTEERIKANYAKDLAASGAEPSAVAPRLIPDNECMQSKCARQTSSCWGECEMRRLPGMYGIATQVLTKEIA